MEVGEVFELIAGCTREVVPGLENHIFRQHDRLEALGANSIDRAEIVAAVLESLRLNLPRTAVFGTRNVGELAALIHAKLSI
jgi:polyketide biosynthesis acyl carrier protein